jgi:hypothetical protein
MVDKSKDFPQYRKMSNGKCFYKIISDLLFLEKQLMGTKVFEFTVEAKQYPEMLLIKDMLDLSEWYVLSDETEWNLIKI